MATIPGFLTAPPITMCGETSEIPLLALYPHEVTFTFDLYHYSILSCSSDHYEHVYKTDKLYFYLFFSYNIFYACI